MAVTFGTADLTCGNLFAGNVLPIGGFIPTSAKTLLWYGSPITATAALTTTQSLLYATPIEFAGSQVITDVGIEVTTNVGSALVRLGIYNDDGNNTGPGTLLVDFGTIDASTGSTTAGTLRTITSLTQALAQGRHWLCAVSQGAAAIVRGCSGPAYSLGSNSATPGNFVVAGYTWAAQTGALVSPWAGTFVGASPVPRVMIKLQ